MASAGFSQHLIVKRLHAELDGIYAVCAKVVEDGPVYIIRACRKMDLVYKTFLLVFICNGKESGLLLYGKPRKASAVESHFNRTCAGI